MRLLAAQRLTEMQLWARLERRGYPQAELRATLAACRAEGFLDDGLFARLFVEGRRKPVGDARLVADLVRRGVARELAVAMVERADRREEQRLADAVERLYRVRPGLSYPSAARALERLGFPASRIYGLLRVRAHAELMATDGRGFDSESP